MSLSGKGVTVAVVDGGKDYLHPALGAGFGQGSKVQYGYDFVGDNVKQPNVEAPDDDPYGDCSNHAQTCQQSSQLDLNQAGASS
jgi:subtilisin family serine protease